MGNHPFTQSLRPSHYRTGSVIVITGASSGMGKELAYRYANRGAHIIIGSRNMNKLNEVARGCNKLYPYSKVIPCQTDVTKEDQCKQLIEAAISNFGRIDILILNAGISTHTKFEDMIDLSPFQELMDTNFFGYLYPTRYALPYLKQTNGQIVVMSSYSGEIGLHYRTAYCASKFAVTGFFEALRMELQGTGVDITIICPITVETSFRENALKNREENEKFHSTYEALESQKSAANSDEYQLKASELNQNQGTDNLENQSDQNLTSTSKSLNNEANLFTKLTPEQVVVIPRNPYEESAKIGSSMSVNEAVDVIMQSCDKRARKVFFPTKAWIANYIRPIFPDFIDKKLYQQAKL